MKFVPNPRFAEEMVTIEAAATKIAVEAAKAQAEQIAPRGPTGYYHRSFDIEEEGAINHLLTKDAAGHLIEWGSVKNPPYGTLRRAVQGVGLLLRESPRP